MRLTHEGGHQRHEQKQNQPRVIDQQAGSKGGDRHHILALGEQLPHQRHPATGLPARAFQLVLKIGVLKIFKVQGRGMFHQPDRGSHGQLVGQQRIQEANHPTQNIRQDRQPEFGGDIERQSPQMPGLPPAQRGGRVVGQSRQVDHIVDDQLADPQSRDRKHRPRQAQHDRGHGQQRARIPDQPEKRRYVAQGRKARAVGSGRRCGRFFSDHDQNRPFSSLGAAC